MKASVRNDVQKLRARTGLTQEELAAGVGVSRQTVIAIEKGNYTPSVLLALKLAKYFNKPLEQVFYIYER